MKFRLFDSKNNKILQKNANLPASVCDILIGSDGQSYLLNCGTNQLVALGRELKIQLSTEKFDKNNVEIYCGDQIEFVTPNGTRKNGVVSYDNVSAKFIVMTVSCRQYDLGSCAFLSVIKKK